MGRLENKVALITGATSGMGESFAETFAREGAKIVIVGRNEEHAIKVSQKIDENGGKARYILCDVTNQREVDALKREFLKYYNKLDILVNNAGVLITAPLEEIKEEDWLKVFDTNTHSVMRVTQAFMDVVENAKGNILINASIDGLQSLIRGRANYAYCASKAAVIKFAQHLALNYSNKGIRINCLCPGVTETPFFTNRDFSRFNNSIPMGRVGQVQEIANAALFLVSDEASYISGAVLTVDGGASLL